MPHDPRKTRLKILGSLTVLAIVMVIAVIAQFTGNGRWNRDNRQTSDSTARSTQPRAVFGDTTSPPPRQQESPPPSGDISTRSRADTPGAATTQIANMEIDDLLNHWRDSVIRGDVNAHVILYAPKMDQFFRRRNVTRETVRREKARMMELYPRVNRYEISDIRVESQRGNEAVVSFRKEWDMRGDRPFSGAERQRLKLRRMSGDWKIVSEEETKVYWIRRR
jgi:hypothetical protein